MGTFERLKLDFGLFLIYFVPPFFPFVTFFFFLFFSCRAYGGLFCSVLWESISLYSLGCPWTHWTIQTGLKTWGNPPASASQMQHVPLCLATSWLDMKITFDTAGYFSILICLYSDRIWNRNFTHKQKCQVFPLYLKTAYHILSNHGFMYII